ncbi:MAG: rhomboid family intramembrane serine protease [Gammaproteobacteria bacterium]|nr:rhomboid family intramembrane serine protease [Gammaproteobacteria bacterium]
MLSETPVLLKPIAFRVIVAIIILWLIKGVELAFNTPFNHYGVEPREVSGLLGILFAPLIHGSFEHLLSNTLALFVLTTALFYEYPKSAKATFLIIYLGSGIGVWLFARDAYHFGASGLTHGMMFFLFLIGVLRRDKPAMALAMIVFFLYGSMVWGILPTKEEISFETHLFGALMGVICAITFRNKDPIPPEKVYSWEKEEEQQNGRSESREDVLYLDEK